MLFCPGSLTFNPTDAATCPPLSEQAPALTFAALTAFLSLGGAALFWIRRREPLLAKRDVISAFALSSVTILAGLSSYFGETIPCWAFFALNTAINALVPGIILVRFWGLFARHLRQAEAIGDSTLRSLLHPSNLEQRAASPGGNSELPGDVLYDVPGTSLLRRPAGSPDPRPIAAVRCRVCVRACNAHAALAKAFALRYRIDDPRRSFVLLLTTCVPLTIYFFVRLAVSPARRSSNVGCFYDAADSAVSGLVSILAVATAIPAITNLGQFRDSLFLRIELACQIIIWPPMIAWLLYDFSRPNGSYFSTLKGLYGILLGCFLTLLTALWAPALLSFVHARHARRRVAPVEGQPSQQKASKPPELPAVAPPVVPSDIESVSDSGVLHHPTLPQGRQAAGVAVITATLSISPVGSIVLDERSVAVAVPSILESAALAEMIAVAARFLTPAPTTLELVATLRMPVPSLRQSDRSLTAFAAMLLATGSGMALLEETLRLSLSAELLGFLVDADDLRRGASELMVTVPAEDRRCAPPPAVAHPPPNARLLSHFIGAFAHFLSRYVAHGAPHYVNVGRTALTLLEAARALRLRKPTSGAAVEEVRGALRTLANAEVDVFERVVFEPLVWRMRTHPDLFVDWAAGVLRDLEAHGGSGAPLRAGAAGDGLK